MAGRTKGQRAKSKVKPSPAKPKAAAKKSPAKDNGKAIFDVLVQFKNVNVGDGTARTGIVLARELLTLSQMDSAFCERRLSGTIALGSRKDDPAQQLLIKDADYRIDGSFDTKKFSVGKKTYTSGLTFNLSEIDVQILSKFAGRQGRLILRGVGDIPVDVVKEGDAPKRGMRQTKIREEISLDELFAGNDLKGMKEKGLERLGDLDLWLQKHALTELKGVGEERAAKIADIMATIPHTEPNDDEDDEDDDGDDNDE